MHCSPYVPTLRLTIRELIPESPSVDSGRTVGVSENQETQRFIFIINLLNDIIFYCTFMYKSLVIKLKSSSIMRYLWSLFTLLFVIQLSFFQLAYGQEGEEREREEENEEENRFEMETRNFLSLSFGYTYIPKGAELDATEEEGFFVPSLGIDYMYRLTPRWEIGTMMDVELDHYLVFEKDLERENAFIATIIGLYKVTPRFSVYAGGGIEFETHENLAVFRIGVDSPIPLGREWVMAPTFLADFKEGYDTWS